MEQIVFKTQKGNAATDTRRVAKAFGKTHGNVLKALDVLGMSSEFNLLNFKQLVYTDSRNRPQRVIEMTDEGYAALVNSFRARRSNLSETCTYIILAEGIYRVKIGKAVNITKRITQLQCGCPVPLKLLLLVEQNIESELHKRFKHLSTGGEWFIYNDEAREAFAGLLQLGFRPTQLALK